MDAYKDEVIPCETTQVEWPDIADEFQRKWNVPHACGALDGKHVSIRCPDADYKFLWADIGAQIFNDPFCFWHLHFTNFSIQINTLQ